MKKKWWHEKIGDQIYPKSILDTNGDGVGDLTGVIEKLPYLEQLGVDILWLSPVYPSPMVDNGYDISDYENIDPRFGTLEDMDRLIAEAKKKNISIIMDLVVNHCSDQHAWFRKAIADPKGPYGDYFYLKEGKDGKEPNNWRSYFGGSVWEKLPGQENLYYYHAYAKEQPFFMGILVSVIVGVALTLPISSAAICAALNLTGLAGGAAVAGCCAQMVGFAAMSFKENKWSGLISQGLGTSMLQMGNIVKNPRIWIPPTLAAAITGPIATCLFQLQMNGPAVSSGMGTCGLVGQIGVYTGWLEEIAAGSRSQITAFDWIGMILICFVLPAVLSLVFGQILRKIGWIKEDDLKL